MTDGRMALIELIEEGAEGGLVRELLAFAAERPMTIWENVKDAECWNRVAIAPSATPFKPKARMAILRGNLVWDGVGGGVRGHRGASPPRGR